MTNDDGVSDTTARRKASGEMYYLPADSAIRDGFDAFDKSEEEIAYEQFAEEARESNQYAKMSVFRIPVDDRGNPKGKGLTFLFEAPLTEMTYSQLMSRIRDEHGTGTYRLQVRNEGGALKMNRNIMVEAPKGPELSGSKDNLVIREIAQVLGEQSRRQEEMYERLSRMNQSSGFNFKEALTYIVPIATALSALGITFKPKQEKSTLEVAQELAALKGLFTGDDGGDDNLYSLLGKVATGFGPALAAAISHGQQRGGVDPSGQVRPRQISGPRVTADQSIRNKPVNEQIESMRPQLQFLLMQAQMRNDPQSVADFMVDNIMDSEEITDDQIDTIIDALQQPDCYQQCVTVIPAFQQYMEWFAAWRDAMLAGLLDDNENGTLTDDGEAGQDASDPPPSPETESDVVSPARNANGNPAGRGRDQGDAEHHAETGADMEKESATPTVST